MNIKNLLLIAALSAALPFTCSAADDKAPAKAATPAKTAASSKQVDINSASAADLEALPTIGKAKSAKIIAGRPWKGKDDLVAKGILSAADYAKVKDMIIAKQAK
jgi:DNA uptake protein ComE-like DNA-binding protein